MEHDFKIVNVYEAGDITMNVSDSMRKYENIQICEEKKTVLCEIPAPSVGDKYETDAAEMRNDDPNEVGPTGQNVRCEDYECEQASMNVSDNIKKCEDIQIFEKNTVLYETPAPSVGDKYEAYINEMRDDDLKKGGSTGQNVIC